MTTTYKDELKIKIKYGNGKNAIKKAYGRTGFINSMIEITEGFSQKFEATPTFDSETLEVSGVEVTLPHKHMAEDGSVD